MPIIQLVYENTSMKKRLKAAWGFSAHIRFRGKNILFDTGGDEEIFTSNMKKLDIDPKDIDLVFISHKHWDHVAGLSLIKKAGAKHIKASNFGKILPAVYTTGALRGKVPEQSLIIDTFKGLIVITGCSHPGIIKIVKFAKQKLKKDVYMVLGGFHLYQSKIAEIEVIAKELRSLGIKKLAPCHCTGRKALSVFKKEWKKSFIKVDAGSTL
ncbi:MAG: MBL fold metallo-hydrolase [Candidatus Saganbacteria bacterium]|nr:MBL fold metallo-hydrolase [Candidatus Saganbacteria bacterium]